MKNYFYLLTLAFLANSCEIVQDERPPTVFEKKKPAVSQIPVYFPPGCSSYPNTTDGNLLNFNVSFQTIPTVTIVDKTLTFTNKNNQNDQVTIILSHFVPGQSTVYNIDSSPNNLSDYSAYIELNINALNTFSKFNAKSTYGGVLHVKYYASNHQYEMVFCDKTFTYIINSNTALEIITGAFTFTQ